MMNDDDNFEINHNDKLISNISKRLDVNQNLNDILISSNNNPINN